MASTEKTRAAQFAARWQGRGDEKQETQAFWFDLLRSVYGIENIVDAIEFEKKVQLSHTSYIDAYIPDTKVLIEQKSLNVDLNKAAKQSDGTLCTPYEQARRYAKELPLSLMPRFIVVCNFKEFLVYDEEYPHAEPFHILLEDLPEEYSRLSFLTGLNEVHLKKQISVSVQAGELVGKIYDAIHKEYLNPQDQFSLKSLNILCVRLVFCLYAEDSDLFRPNQFCDYLSSREPRDLRKAIIELFEVLNTPYDKRDPYLIDELAAFPYVDGGLFAKTKIEIPNFTQDIKDVLAHKASEDFNWSKISPTIFGAIFESTLNPETRRQGGMHFTSIENIHKLIDPLFLDELNREFEDIEKKIFASDKKRANLKTGAKTGLYQSHIKLLRAFQNKLAGLKFLDPACGSGNFLTETFLSLRRLENKVLALLSGSGDLFIEDSVKVTISQFYGIEINDFAVAVAKTALWIAEAQMLEESNAILTQKIDYLPLRTQAKIVEGNALKLDWEEICPKDELHYIMSNPPFVGYKLQTDAQKEELSALFKAKNLDYVAGWYDKAAEFIQNSACKCAFVSTNSLCQGEQVLSVWQELFSKYSLQIDFAWRTFKWTSDSLHGASVYVIIAGFSFGQSKSRSKTIFTSAGDRLEVKMINPYLLEAPAIFIKKRLKPICDVPEMIYGSEPREGGFLILDEEQREQLIEETPQAESYIKRFVSADDFINNNIRYCLWFKGKDPSVIRKSKILTERINNCRKFRLDSKQKQACAMAEYPYLFASERQPQNDYLLIPVVSSERRNYIPIGYVGADTVCSNACFTISNIDLYHLGILLSSVHMAWVRTVCGRLKADYRYSNSIVYNNFVWPQITPDDKEQIAKTALAILEARKLYPGSTLADLYDPLTMPLELKKAHLSNDKAVSNLYGFKSNASDEEMAQRLFLLYAQKVQEEGQAAG